MKAVQGPCLYLLCYGAAACISFLHEGWLGSRLKAAGSGGWLRGGSDSGPLIAPPLLFLPALGDDREAELPAEILPGENEAGGGVYLESGLQETLTGAGEREDWGSRDCISTALCMPLTSSKAASLVLGQGAASDRPLNLGGDQGFGTNVRTNRGIPHVLHAWGAGSLLETSRALVSRL